MRKKNKQVKVKKKYLETKAVFVFSLNILLFLSLITFKKDFPSVNWLGYLGYYSSYPFTYLFGLGSYLLILFVGYQSIKTYSKNSFENTVFKSITFFALFFSACFFLKIYADSNPNTASIFQDRIFITKVYKYFPKPQFLTRYNLGGSFFYYIYSDIAYLNLKKILSQTGCSLIFSTTAITSFLLFTGINIITAFNRLYQFFKTKRSNLKKRKKKYILRKLLAFLIESFGKIKTKKPKTNLENIKIKIKEP